MIKYYITGTLLLVLVVLCGCSGEPPKAKVVPVSGTVTLGSKPLEGVQVFMTPVETDGKSVPVSASGKTDSAGKFQLKTSGTSPRTGAMPGANSVFISFEHLLSEETSEEEVKAMNLPTLPPEWSDGSLIFDVPPTGTDQANFEK